jgi:L-lysine exporter family protein LysE/ArgO
MTALLSGFSLSLSLIIAIGPQNAHVLRMGLARRHLLITVAACAITDLVLIALGVLGLAKLSMLSPLGHRIILLGAIAFLCWYGWKAARRALASSARSLDAAQDALPKTAKQALLTALAFSWLNPHAWLDTAVLIGSASLAYGPDNNLWFGLGAAIGSAAWFAVLAWVAMRLSSLLASPATWRAIDALVALTMLGTAAWILFTL